MNNLFSFRRLPPLLLALAFVPLIAVNQARAQSPNCSAAVPNDNTSDTDAINNCLANQSVVILEDGASTTSTLAATGTPPKPSF